MKGFLRRGLAVALTAVMVMGLAVSAFAQNSNTDEKTQVTIEDGDKPYISFGLLSIF